MRILLLSGCLALSLYAGLAPDGTYTPGEPILTPMGEWK